jgi:hypothetical protein
MKTTDFYSYWNGFRISFLTSCSAGALVFGALSWLFVSYIDGDNPRIDTFKQESLEAMELTEGMMKSIMGESQPFDQSVENIITNMEYAMK